MSAKPPTTIPQQGIAMLPLDETVRLLERFTPVENILVRSTDGGTAAMWHLSDWYRDHGLEANRSINRHWRKMGEQIGAPATMYRNYEFRCAIWGLSVDETQCLLLKSIRGTELYVDPKLPLDKCQDLVGRIAGILHAVGRQAARSHGCTGLPPERRIEDSSSGTEIGGR